MSKAKILVVEDDDDLRRALTRRLASWGFDVVQAQDGVMAISVARVERPDLIVLDIGLPGGDGISVLDRMANLPALAATPVLVLTGRDPVQAEPAVRKYGVAGFLQKPADNEEFAAAIAQALRLEGPAQVATRMSAEAVANWFG